MVPERVCASAGEARGSSCYHYEMRRADEATVIDAVVAGAIAAVVSGVPSTAHAIITRHNPLEASLAAGTLLLPREQRWTRLLPAAIVAHALLSLGWACALAALLPRRRTVEAAALAGLAIAALDLGCVGRRFPRIRALPLLPQVLDHLAYSVTVAAVLRARRGRPLAA
ncbi:MAG: hypothetical protein QOD83_4577 [Solirubrobacteraceae bacterium]|nr:hypothetical protein [Solirubrobacteraceae bacterium]